MKLLKPILAGASLAILYGQSVAIACDGVKVSGALGNGDCVGSKTDNPIFALIGQIVAFLTGLFGLILVAMVVYAGIQYITAQGSSDNVKAAKQRLEQAITGLVLFALMFALLQMLIPGGVFN